MKINFVKPVFLTVLLGTASLSSVALADTYVKGTQVSYDKDIDAATKANNSSVFIDEANDTRDKNYVEFSCEQGASIFYLHSDQNFYSQKEYDAEKTPPLTMMVDGGKPVTMTTVSVEIDGEANFKAIALDDKFDAQMLRTFQTAKTKVVLSFTRLDKKILNFTFYPKGFNDAFKAVNSCK